MNLTAWRRYIRFYRRFYLTLIVCAVASALQPLILLPVALLIRRAFDEAIPAKNFYLLALIGAAIFLANLASEAITLFITYRILRVTKLVTQRLRHKDHRGFAVLKSQFSQVLVCAGKCGFIGVSNIFSMRVFTQIRDCLGW